MRKITFLLSAFLMYLGTMNANAAIGDALPRSGWSIVASSACDESNTSGQIATAIDGKIETYWHSNWGGSNASGEVNPGDLSVTPEYFILDLGSVQTIGGVGYVPRTDNGTTMNGNGALKDYKIYFSTEAFSSIKSGATNEEKRAALELTNPVLEGTGLTWPSSAEQKFATTTAVQAQYIMVVFLQSYGDPENKFANCSEFNVYEFQSDNKPALIEAIAVAQAQANAEIVLVGTNPGQYTSAATPAINALFDAIAAAQAVVDDEASTDAEEATAIETLNAAVAAYDEAAAAFAVNPLVAGIYKINLAIKSGEYSIYDNGSRLAWKAFDANDLTFYWNVTETAGGFTIQNAAYETYMADCAGWNDKFTLVQEPLVVEAEFLGSVQFRVKVDGGMMHAQSNGGESGNIVYWDGGANSASAWKFVPVDEIPQAAIDAWNWKFEDMTTYLKAGKRVSTLEDGKEYLIYNTSKDGYDRTGFLYSNSNGSGLSLDRATSSALVLTENTDWSYVWTVEVTEGGYYLKTPVLDGSGKYNYINNKGAVQNTPYKFYIQEWTASATDIKAGVNSLNEDGTTTANADITADNKVWTVSTDADGNNKSWNGNTGNFVTWSTSHAFAFYTVEEAKYPVTLNASGIDGVGNLATFSAPIATEVPAGTTAYVAAQEGNYVILTALEEGKAIPANTGVILEATETELVMLPTTTVPVAEGFTNVLMNTATGAKTAAALTNAYVLTGNNGVASFCKLATGTLAANKAYIVVAAEPAEVRLMFDGEATGIEGVTVAQDANAPVYDLSGRLVKATKSGIYVSKGKKFIVK